jgi:universal stress protein A
MKPRILVPFDFSDGARRALEWAADLQKTTATGRIHMVNAISSLETGFPDVAGNLMLPTPEEMADLEKAMLAAAEQNGATAKATVGVRPVPVGDIILDTARETETDLIVMGTHGRSGMARLFMGSVAEHVLRHANCPVVTIRNLRAG